MAIKGFINKADADNIKVKYGSARLRYDNKNASNKLHVNRSNNAQDHRFYLEGEGSENYELVEDTADIYAKIKPRPISVKLFIPPQEYNKDLTVDLQTVAYKFLSTNSDESGLIEGYQRNTHHGLSTTDTTIHVAGSDIDSFTVLDTLVYDNVNLREYTLSTRSLHSNWQPIIYNEGKYKLKIPFYGNVLKSDNMTMAIKKVVSNFWHANTAEDSTCKFKSFAESSVSYGGLVINCQPLSNVKLAVNRSKDSYLRIHSINLFDQENVSLHPCTTLVPEFKPLKNNKSLICSSSLIPGRYRICWKGKQLTIARLCEMTGLNRSQLAEANIACDINGWKRSTSDNIVTDNSFIVSFGTGEDADPSALIFDVVSLQKIISDKNVSDDAFLFLTIPADGIASSDTAALALNHIQITPLGFYIPDNEYVPYASEIIDLPASGTTINFQSLDITYGMVIDCRNVESATAEYEKAIRYREENEEIEIVSELETDETSSNYIHIKDIPSSDFGKLLFSADSIKFTDSLRVNETVKLQVEGAKLTDTDGITANNYRLVNVEAYTRLIPRRIYGVADVSDKTWDGTTDLPVTVTLYEKDGSVLQDDVQFNYDYIQAHAVSPDIGYNSITLSFNHDVAALIGANAHLYTLDSIDIHNASLTDIQVHPLDVNVVVEAVVFNVSKNNALIDSAEIIYTLVDYNNNVINLTESINLDNVVIAEGSEFSWVNDGKIYAIQKEGEPLVLKLKKAVGNPVYMKEGDDISVDFTPIYDTVQCNAVRIKTTKVTSKVVIKHNN